MWVSKESSSLPSTLRCSHTLSALGGWVAPGPGALPQPQWPLSGAPSCQTRAEMWLFSKLPRRKVAGSMGIALPWPGERFPLRNGLRMESRPYLSGEASLCWGLSLPGFLALCIFIDSEASPPHQELSEWQVAVTCDLMQCQSTCPFGG